VNQQLGDMLTASATGLVTQGAGRAGQLVTQGTALKVKPDKTIDGLQGMGMLSESITNFNRVVGNAAASSGIYEKAFVANYSQMVYSY
jgi:hypothetical protein